MLPVARRKYRIDPNDPRAPAADVWAEMTPAERAAVVAELPSEFEASEEFLPEGTAHFEAKVRTRTVLRTHFERTGRSFFIACELPIYYPGERMFAPDIMVVLDVPETNRQSWIVSHEGRGVDVAMEILYSGRRRKDLVHNVERYGRLGIPEYFVFDALKLSLRGYRLGPGETSYQALLPNRGRLCSMMLGLDLGIVDGNLRFYRDEALLPEPTELLAQLTKAVDEQMQRRLEAEERQLEAEERQLEAEERAEAQAQALAEEARLRAQAEQKLAQALAELDRLRHGST
ncbi:MAG: Uma2 family endonuclease [Rhodospirillales bacterium]|nr:Uma2 family endonuclease [Rhodospirillales bacterium]